MRLRVTQRWADAGQAVLWLVASALLVRRNSLWTPVATAALVLWLTGLRRRELKQDRPDAPLPGPISPPLPRPPLRPMLQLTGAGMLLNAAMLSEGTGRAVAAGVFVAGAAAIVLRRIRREQVARLNRASVILALLLTFIGLLRWGGGRFFGFDGASGADAADTESGSVRAASRRDDLTFRGVMIYVTPPKQKDAIPPPPPPVRRADEVEAARKKREPLVIPFSGVYWLFHRPDREPPPSSLVRHGSPDELYFRASDYRPLVMEAHQQLDQAIDLRCCAFVDLAIANLDKYPGSVRVELIVSDTAYPIPMRRRLGSQPVLTSPPLLSSSAGAQPSLERLRFPIAASTGPMRFDRISVRFHLNQGRDTRSARMAIRNFSLIPR